MTKNEIKLALTAANVSFAKKANLEQLTALYNENILTRHPDAPVDEVNPFEASMAEQEHPFANEAPVEEVTPVDEEFTSGLQQAGVAPVVGEFVNCPGCGIHLDNGVLCHTDESITEEGMGSGKSYHQAGEMTTQYECLGCGHAFGEALEPYVAPAAPVHTGTGLKIEKDRVEQNGIKRPSVGGKCRAIWDYLDALVAAQITPTAKQVKEDSVTHGWNPNNASIEFYQWRKFNGIQGRAPKA
jgi:hypothetical protein